jgi:hypothetical protein
MSADANYILANAALVMFLSVMQQKESGLNVKLIRFFYQY